MKTKGKLALLIYRKLWKNNCKFPVSIEARITIYKRSNLHHSKLVSYKFLYPVYLAYSFIIFIIEIMMSDDVIHPTFVH